MGKDFKNIDELIKSGLQGFKTEAPPDAWDAIAGEIGQKDRKLTPVFWRWAAAIAILIGLAVVLKTQFINPDRQQITKIENLENSNQSISNEKEKQEIDRNIRPLLNNNEINPKDKSGNKSEIPPRPPETKAAVGNEKLLANSSGDQGKNIPEKN
ncbi:MAG: hypothetical protein U9R19_02525, partial [Bacteroidota bacterium]|nr:hypothetical protein [Bacteroidota bacterium]